jgi:Transglutaminase-like superfamily
MSGHKAWGAAWMAVNALLAASVFFLLFAAEWEFSTRQYLQGFAAALTPATANGEEKVIAIISWMARGPARQNAESSSAPVRDPQATLNNSTLLRVCGTATNAFVNLANAGGVPARRLLLLDQQRRATHVVAEVYLDGRWVVVDPVFHLIPRGADGRGLTREQLRDPQTLPRVTTGIPQYLPDYNYQRTAHLRMGRVPLLGLAVESLLNRVLPGWEDSVFWTLLAERESFAVLVLAVFIFVFLLVCRIVLHWYARARLGMQFLAVREQKDRAAQTAFSRST